MATTKVFRKNANWRRLEDKGFKRQVKSPRGVIEEGSLITFLFFFIFECKKNDNKSISESTFTNLNY